MAYFYSQKLILQSNDDINDENKYNLAQETLKKTIEFTEILAKKYNKNINVLEHLYKLYQQSGNEKKEAEVKTLLKRFGAAYIFEE